VRRQSWPRRPRALPPKGRRSVCVDHLDLIDSSQLEAQRAENSRLRADLEIVLQQLAAHNAVSVTAPTLVPPPTAPQTTPASTFAFAAEPVASASPGGFDGFGSTDSGFGSPADSSAFGFGDTAGDFGGPGSGFSDQPFSPAAGGFDSFGTASAQDAPDFNAFASDPQLPAPAAASNGFAAFDMDGFGATSPASAASSSSARASAFDAFDF
jgi:hypothetical protein